MKRILARHLGSKWRNAIAATSWPATSSMNHLFEGGVSRTMQRSHNPNGRSPLATRHVQEVLRFARKLGMHSDADQLLRALPSELYALLDCTATAVIHLRQGRALLSCGRWRRLRALTGSFLQRLAKGDLVRGSRGGDTSGHFLTRWRGGLSRRRQILPRLSL